MKNKSTKTPKGTLKVIHSKWLETRAHLTASVSQWSDELGMTKDTLSKRLRQIDFQWTSGERISAKIVFQALTGDLDVATARLRNAEAELKEDKLKVKQGKMIDVEQFEKTLNEVMIPITQRFQALPNEAAHDCNPTDPQFAREALKRWLARSMPIIRGWKRKSP